MVSQSIGYETDTAVSDYIQLCPSDRETLAAFVRIHPACVLDDHGFPPRTEEKPDKA